MKTAAEDGRWIRDAERESYAARIAAAIIKHPRLTNAEIANMIGASAVYVAGVRRKVKLPEQTPDARPQFKYVGEHAAEGCE